MDFAQDPAAEALVARARAFLDERALPIEARFLLGEDVHAALDGLRDEVKELGLWGPTAPKEYGGMGLSLVAFAPLSEALGRSPIGHYIFNCQAPDAGNMEILHDHGSEAQKEAFLAPLARGEVRSCFAMTEPDRAGSNPVWMDTLARKDGEDYVIDGRKWFTTAADGAAFCIVMAITDPEAPSPHARASQIIVPADNPGFTVVRNIPVMGDVGSGHHSHSETRFENCRVPQSNILGAEGAGFTIAQERLGPGRIHHCMRWIGICERSFEMMVKRAATRMLKPDRPLASRQAVQHWISESRAEIDAARLMVLRAAWRIDKEGAYAARRDVSLIKFFVANVLQRVLDRAVQTHGALGMTDQTPLAFWYRHERAARIYDGADEVHKSAAARLILKEHGVDAR